MDYLFTDDVSSLNRLAKGSVLDSDSTNPLELLRVLGGLLFIRKGSRTPVSPAGSRYERFGRGAFTAFKPRAEGTANPVLGFAARILSH